MVALTGRRAAALEDVAGHIAAAGGRAVVCDSDAADPAAMALAAGRIASLGQLAVVVTAAGANVASRRWSQLSAVDIALLVDANLNAALYVTHAALPLMRPSGGVFVHIESWTAHFPSALAGPVCMAAKTAVVAMSHALNMEEGRNDIRSTVVSPGEVVTPLMDKRPVPVTAAERAVMLQPHVCINEVVMSPAANRLHH